MKKKIRVEEDYLEQIEKKKKANSEFYHEKKISDLDPTANINKVEEVKPEIEQEPKKKRSKNWIYLLIILAVTGLSLYFSLSSDFNGIITNFQKMDVPFFIYGCLCFLGIFLINSLIYFLFARRYKKKYFYGQGMAIECVGNFYNAVTPSASGGQFMQAYTYKKQGISVSNATSCLVMNFIVYQTVLILLAIVAVVSKAGQVFTEGYNVVTGIKIGDQPLDLPFWIVMILGFSLQLIVIGMLLLMTTWKKFHNFILHRGINFFHKIKLVKKPDEARRKLSVAIESYKIELKNLFSNPRFLILIFILHVASLSLRYLLPYFINIAVCSGNDALYNYSAWDTMCFASIHKMATELIPIPGGAGISETFYNTVFLPAYTTAGSTIEQAKAFTNAAQILWRVITFHVPLLVTGLVTAFYKGKPGKEEVEILNKGGVTFLTIQMNTIDERRKTYNTLYATRVLSKKDLGIKKERKSKKKVE